MTRIGNLKIEELLKSATDMMNSVTAIASSQDTRAIPESLRRTIDEALKRYGMVSDDVPPVVWTVFATSVSQALVMERALGISTGHAETFAFCERWIRRLEGDPLPEFAQGWESSSARV